MLKEAYYTDDDIKNVAAGIRDRVREVNPRFMALENAGLKSALLIADMQKYFLNPASHAFVPSANAIIPNIIKLVRHFRESGEPVFFTRHYNRADDSGMMGAWWRNLLERNSEGFNICEELSQLSAGKELDKEQYDAFHGTMLESRLRENGVAHLVIAGIMTNLCCETTLRSAFVKGFRVSMPVDATATYNREFHFGTYLNLSFGFSPPVLTDELLDMITR